MFIKNNTDEILINSYLIIQASTTPEVASSQNLNVMLLLLCCDNTLIEEVHDI
jgi:hypothetical protein